jgi:hypothetical protein
MSIPPQPSPVVPQPTPSAAHVVGVQVAASLCPQTLGFPPPPQVSAPVHVPHASIPPQPSDCAPQLKPSFAHVVGTQATLPHWLGVPPPPHVWVSLQLPQSSIPPQPFDCVPQLAWRLAHVFGVQRPPSGGVPQTPGLPPPPHVSVPLHDPHWMTLPQPSPWGPQLNSS